MKLFTGALGALSLLTVSTPMSTGAMAQPSPGADGGVVAACQGSSNFPNEPPGNCIAIRSNFIRGNTQGAVANVCSFAEAEEPDLFYYFYASHADCVRDGASVFLD